MPLAQPLATKEPYGCGIPLAGASRRVLQTQNRWYQQRRARVSPPYAKGVVFAPKPKLCVGRDAHSAAVGGFAALRMRHTPCGCIAPRIPDAESTVPAAGAQGAPLRRKRKILRFIEGMLRAFGFSLLPSRLRRAALLIRGRFPGLQNWLSSANFA